jgi:putative endonuclease
MISYTKQQTGSLGENLAIPMLKRKGYLILDTNYRHSRYGEIDLIAQDKDVLVFVEVKTRHNVSHGMPAEAVTPGKLKKITCVAQAYLREEGKENCQWRVDVIAIGLDTANKIVYQEHFQNVTM